MATGAAAESGASSDANPYQRMRFGDSRDIREHNGGVLDRLLEDATDGSVEGRIRTGYVSGDTRHDILVALERGRTLASAIGHVRWALFRDRQGAEALSMDAMIDHLKETGLDN